MTIPMIPGVGDTLAKNLPALGTAIRDILMPNKQYEVALRQALAADPTLASKLATIEKDNPGAIGSIYGKNAGQFAQGLQETPQAQLQRRITGAAAGTADQRMGDVGAAALGIDSDVVREGRALENESNRFNLDQGKQWAQLFNSLPPEIQKDAVFFKHLGMPESEYKNVQRRAQRMKDAEQLTQADAPSIVKGFLSGKISSDQVQGWIDNNPDSAKAILGLLQFDKEARLRRELAALSNKEGRRDFMQLAYIETVKDARKLGVSPVALFKFQTGVDASQAVPEFAGKPATNEEVTAAGEAYTRHAQAERSKTLRPVSIALKAFEDDPSTGSAAAVTAALQSADLPIEVVWDTKGWNEKKYYMTLDTGEKVEINSDMVAQAVSTGQLPAPGSDTKTGGNAPSKPVSGKITPVKLDGTAKVLVDRVKEKKYDRKTVEGSASYQGLSEDEKKAVAKELGW